MTVPELVSVPELAPESLAGARRRRLPAVGTMLAVVWLGGLGLMAFLADPLPFVKDYGKLDTKVGRYKSGPSWDHFFGTDKLGRDVFSRCIYGAQKSLTIAVMAIVFGLLVGGILGLLAGYFRGWPDRLLSVGFDALLAFPPLVLALVVVARLFEDNRFMGVTVVLTVLSIAPLARIVRAQTLSLSQREYVLAARGLGARSGRILIREILPNVVPAMVSVAFTGVAILLVAEGGLSLLGFSVKVPTPTWGFMINEARPDLDKSPSSFWATFFPCLMLFLTVLSFNVLGDRLARRFDIREATL